MKILDEAFAAITRLPIKAEVLADCLSPQEIFGLTTFIFLMVVVYGLAITALCKAVPDKSGKRVRLTAPDWFFVSLAVLGLLCTGYGFFVEPYLLETSHVQLSSPKLRGHQSIRIAHISDLHCDPEPRIESRLVRAVLSEHPDLVVFTGDAINSPEGLPVLRKCLRAIARKVPTYAVRGNHDVRQWRFIDIFKKTGVHELDGRGERISVGDNQVWIGGLAVDHESKFADLFAQMPKDIYSVLLYHFPSGVYKIAQNGADLFCTGHTHGGQVRLPVYGAIITRSILGKNFESGLYKQDATWVYVNRGLGMEGGAAPRVRFMTPPELTIIDLIPSPELAK
jgi:uncharacterized protein